MLCANKNFIKEEEIKVVFLELETIAEEMKQSTQEVLNAKGLE
jgi:hypothetical protein